MREAPDQPALATAVALVGFMATGKSAVGRLAADLLHVPFIDGDEVIERRHGSIDEIFAAHGETVFRRIERDEIVPLLRRVATQPGVIALGGGAVLSGDVREALALLPHVVWLQARADVLWERAAGAPGRPLAADEQQFRRLLDERSALYESVATDEVSNDGRSPLEEVAAQVARIASSPGRSSGRSA